MPPRARGGRRPSRTSIGKASELMGPPPAPGTANPQPISQDVKPDSELGAIEDPLSQKILGPEVKALKERLIDSATIMAQMVNHHTDVHKVGVQRQAPYPPRSLRESWLRQSELYEELIDTVEIQLRRALSAVEYQIEQEQEKFKLKAEAEELQRNGTTSAKARKQSLFIDIPRFDEMNIDPLTVHPDINLGKASNVDTGDTEMLDGTLTEEPTSLLDADDASSRIPSGAVVPKDPGLIRPSRSSISLTSLNRHGLKLDLSSLTMDSLADNKSALPADRTSVSALGGIGGGKAVASPVTLAPKSARPRSDFDPLNAFLTSAVDINIEDLFGDSEMPFPDSTGGDGSVGGARAAAVIESFLSAQNLLPNVKTEDVPIDLLGGTNNHTNTTSETTAQDKLFEELGFVEVESGHMPTASTSAAGAAGVNMAADLSVFGGDNGMGMGIGPLQFSNPSTTTGTTNFDMMGLETQDADIQRIQQQQRQQFGLDLGLPTSLDGGIGQADSKMLDQYQQLLADNPAVGNVSGGGGELADFNFGDLFGAAGDASSTSAGVDGGLNFTLFDEAPNSNNNGKSA